MFSQLDYEAALHHLSENLLRTVADRFLDKKVSFLLLRLSLATHLLRPLSALRLFTVSPNSIALLTLKCSSPSFLACLSNSHVFRSENNDTAATSHFAWIPGSMLQAVGQSILVRYMVPPSIMTIPNVRPQGRR